MVHMTGTNMKQLGVLLVPPRWDASPSQLTFSPLQYAASTHVTRKCAHAHERVIAIVGFSLGRSVRRSVGSVVDFRACAE